ncbi:SDR family NA [Sesbania bispinosa]|nr:SDR family NA [Sesbania bispinosa]
MTKQDGIARRPGRSWPELRVEEEAGGDTEADRRWRRRRGLNMQGGDGTWTESRNNGVAVGGIARRNRSSC